MEQAGRPRPELVKVTDAVERFLTDCKARNLIPDDKEISRRGEQASGDRSPRFVSCCDPGLATVHESRDDVARYPKYPVPFGTVDLDACCHSASNCLPQRASRRTPADQNRNAIQCRRFGCAQNAAVRWFCWMIRSFSSRADDTLRRQNPTCARRLPPVPGGMRNFHPPGARHPNLTRKTALPEAHCAGAFPIQH